MQLHSSAAGVAKMTVTNEVDQTHLPHASTFWGCLDDAVYCLSNADLSIFMEKCSCWEFLFKSLTKMCLLKTPARLIHFLLHPYIANRFTNDPVHCLHTRLCGLLHECIQLSAGPHKLHGHTGQLGEEKQSLLLVSILLLSSLFSWV